MFVHEVQNVILRGNVVIELAHGLAACLCDLADGCRMISLLEENLTGPIHNLLMLLFNERNIFRCGESRILPCSLTPLLFVWWFHVKLIEHALYCFLSNSKNPVKHIF